MKLKRPKEEYFRMIKTPEHHKWFEDRLKEAGFLYNNPINDLQSFMKIKKITRKINYRDNNSLFNNVLTSVPDNKNDRLYFQNGVLEDDYNKNEYQNSNALPNFDYNHSGDKKFVSERMGIA